ncbi:YMD3 protein, partial [Pseudoatta argentina]
WAEPLKAKSGNEATKAIAKITRDDGRYPKNLHIDRGKEFYNSDVQKLLEKHNINYYSTYSAIKASVVERFNRTLKNNMLLTIYNRVNIATSAQYKVDDSVCVSKFKTVFDKGYTPNWSTEVFKIIKVQQINPVTHLLEDSRGESIAGGFYEYELHSVANPDVYLVEKVLCKRGNEVYVKWLGFDNSHNSWIHKGKVL